MWCRAIRSPASPAAAHAPRAATSRRAAEQRDELAAFIIRSPRRRARAAGRGTVKAKCLCGLEVDDESNLVGCKTGRSAGFSPLRISAGIDAGLAIRVRNVRPVAHQAAAIDDSRDCHRLLESHACAPAPQHVALTVESGSVADEQRARDEHSLRHCKARLNLAVVARRQHLMLQTEALRAAASTSSPKRKVSSKFGFTRMAIVDALRNQLRAAARVALPPARRQKCSHR